MPAPVSNEFLKWTLSFQNCILKGKQHFVSICKNPNTIERKATSYFRMYQTPETIMNSFFVKRLALAVITSSIAGI